MVEDNAHGLFGKTIEVGDPVLAMGSPMALSQSVTLGIISNTEMIMPGMFWPFNRMTLDGEDVGSIVRWIGHDAAIFHMPEDVPRAFRNAFTEERVHGWFTGRLPSDWQTAPADITIDREEITVYAGISTGAPRSGVGSRVDTGFT